MSPFNAFQFIQGMETLPLRMREHCAQRRGGRATIWQRHARCARDLPGLQTGEASAAAPSTYLRGGYGGLVGFELKGGREAGARFIDALKLFYHVANIGDARSPGHPSGQHHAFAAERAPSNSPAA